MLPGSYFTLSGMSCYHNTLRLFYHLLLFVAWMYITPHMEPLIYHDKKAMFASSSQSAHLLHVTKKQYNRKLGTTFNNGSKHSHNSYSKLKMVKYQTLHSSHIGRGDQVL